jgi:4-hydroxy-tetrahydrodipicolinate reductase
VPCAGRPLGRVIGIPALVLDACASAGEALSGPCDGFVAFSHPAVAKTHVLQALTAGAHAVVGTSGLTDEDYDEIDRASR